MGIRTVVNLLTEDDKEVYGRDRLPKRSRLPLRLRKLPQLVQIKRNWSIWLLFATRVSSLKRSTKPRRISYKDSDYDPNRASIQEELVRESDQTALDAAG